MLSYGIAFPSANVLAITGSATITKISNTFLDDVKSSHSLIPVLVELYGDPVLDWSRKQNRVVHYFEKETGGISTIETSKYRGNIESSQKSWLETIRTKGISFQENGSATDVVNMVRMDIRGSDIQKVLNFPQVKQVFDDRYQVKQQRSIMALSTGTDKVWKGQDTVKASGKDILVGVIDSGIDGSHPEFNGKIISGQDFTGEGNFRVDSNAHGTHVAGIIGGLGDSSRGKGMAPNVKFNIYKAMGSSGSGSRGSIIDAIDQAVKDKCSVINMSIGSLGGESSREGNSYYPIIKRVVDANIFLSAGAGNAGSRGKSVPWPAGSPGIVEDSFCVAASNDRNFKLSYQSGDKIVYGIYDPNHFFSLPFIHTGEVIDCGYGKPSDFIDKNIKDKIVLLQRGPDNQAISFSSKMGRAYQNGAKAVLFYGNGGEQLITPFISLDDNQIVPYIYMTFDDGMLIKEMIAKKEFIQFKQYTGLSMADFSSMGMTPDGCFKPEITAPGVNIMSTIPKKFGSYAAMSGTSMACPSIAGQAALIREANPLWTIDQIKSAMMNTADLIMNPTFGEPVTYMLQGAGQCRVDKAIQTPLFIQPRAFLVEDAKDSKKVFTVTNASKKSQTLKIKVEVFADSEEEIPFEITIDKLEIALNPSGNETFTADIRMNKKEFSRSRYEGAIWINDLHVPFIILRDSAATDNSKASRNPVSDVFINSQGIDYQQSEKPIKVFFSFNTGREQKYEDQISYSNYGSVKVYVADPQGLEWDMRPIKEFKNCLVGDYSFEWDLKTSNKDFLPNGSFCLKMISDTRAENEILTKPFDVKNSPTESAPSLILSSNRTHTFDNTFFMDLIIPDLNGVSAIEYTLNYDVRKLKIERIEKSDSVVEWETPAYKSESVKIVLTEFNNSSGKLRIKLVRIYFTGKGVGILKFSSKTFITTSIGKKIRSIAYLPTVQITKKDFLLCDLNNDKTVDMNDYFLFAKSYDTRKGDILYAEIADINQDQSIDVDDLNVLTAELGNSI